MSEFHVQVVRIGKVEKHPNADTLSITEVNGGYPVIFRTGEYNEGDLATYIPVDSIVPDTEAWSFLGGHRRIRAKRLRGVFSMGMLAPVPPGLSEGDNAQSALGIEKWEPEVDISTNAPCEKDHGYMPMYTDIEGLRKYKDHLVPGETVIITEKIHGANFRAVFTEGRLWVGSRTRIKLDTPEDMWWKAAKAYDLETRLAKQPGVIFYGEVYGQVQDLKYGAKPGELKLAFFDAMDMASKEYLGFYGFLSACNLSGLPVVPILYHGPWNPDEAIPLSRGKSTLADNVREGFVVKPVVERNVRGLGRVILKMVGEDYLLRKEK